ncbi:hypothetical protein IFM89_031058 [Coptis chinensis]|uniref:Alpha-carbonic anhydrase domain-containing protein n=1 Tax=Coptis chinensis TaxID=261450 RepID=A0A835H881_9MAGN|nr:hypothetical protein IFM89_031058 [Coptis chinensis]
MANLLTIFISTSVAALIWFTLAEGLNFSYSGATGPDYWGSLSPVYNICSNGMAQSPIDIVKDKLIFNPSLGSLSTVYNDTNATFINNLFNVELQFGKEVGEVTIDGNTYTLKRLHWHTPSEHTIDGRYYDAEFHMVHASEDGNITVVAILYEYGASDSFLDQIICQLDQLAREASGRIPIELVKATSILLSTKNYVRYWGSLTAPPCSENVLWNVLVEVREMTIEQEEALKAPLDESCKYNSRPTQPPNGRYA